MRFHDRYEVDDIRIRIIYLRTRINGWRSLRHDCDTKICTADRKALPDSIIAYNHPQTPIKSSYALISPLLIHHRQTSSRLATALIFPKFRLSWPHFLSQHSPSLHFLRFSPFVSHSPHDELYERDHYDGGYEDDHENISWIVPGPAW